MGTELAYTPMLHARLFSEVPTYRDLHFDPGDGPLFAQLAGHDPAVVLHSARMIEEHVDAIDLNFGCPQGIARKGRYGAFLLDEPDVMVALVKTLAEGLQVPVTAKLRLLPERSEAIQLCKRLEEAGASVIALHGRTRSQNKHLSGRADWDAIREAVDALSVPVIANGGIFSRDDADACLAHTGAAAVMSSEALLENPALFCRNIDPRSGEYLDQDALAARYLSLCADHPPSKGAAMVGVQLAHSPTRFPSPNPPLLSYHPWPRGPSSHLLGTSWLRVAGAWPPLQDPPRRVTPTCPPARPTARRPNALRDAHSDRRSQIDWLGAAALPHL